MAESRERKKINFVYEINDKPITLEKKNKACYFIIPLLGYSISYFTTLLNCYLGDNTNKPNLTFKNIFIHIKYYDEKMLRIKYFNQYYRLEDDTYMYVFNIPEEFEEDYIKFCDGQYSKMSKLAKDLICEKSGVRPVIDSLVYKVLYKTNDQKLLIEDLIGQQLKEEYEIYSKPNLDKEIYNGDLKIFNSEILDVEEDIDE